jgi:AcrR family transcriptional regulator
MPPPSQQDRARTTRAALISAARRLFAERGYEDVPADEIASAAGLTRGAMYHHFADKRALFEAVFEELEAEMTEQLGEILASAPPDDLIRAALRAFLDICTRDEVVRIALTEAPAVLGWQRWREIEAQYGLGLVRAGLSTNPAVDEKSADALAHIVLSAVIEAALLIAHSPRPKAARVQAEAALTVLFDRLLPATRSR